MSSFLLKTLTALQPEACHFVPADQVQITFYQVIKEAQTPQSFLPHPQKCF